MPGFDEQDHVRESTASGINEKLDREAEERVRLAAAAGEETIASRIAALEREWDIERKLEANAATLAFIGVLLGFFVSKWWLILPALVTGFLLQHAIQGWCPPIEIFRRLGTRTRKEIERERYALKAVRGDFAGIADASEGMAAPDRALEAVDR